MARNLSTYDSTMSYQALLFCPDDKTARVVTQVLTELEFLVELCNEPFAAVKKLTSQHFDAVVVDCENEQNASLLFKSARNSQINHSSLSVAVVEGQSGVAKAFRIGANLVLTKPINVEQSKGTLRVARGLLRKAESAKPVDAPAPQPSMPYVSTPGLSAAAPSQKLPFARVPAPPPAVSAISPSLLEVEQEPAPAPDPTEVALFESIPDPSAAIKTPAFGLTGGKDKQPWHAASVPSEPPISSVPAGRGSGSAAAPARAKSAPDPAHHAEEDAELSDASSSTVVEPPLFSSVDSSAEIAPSAGAGKKPLLAVAAVVVIALAGYLTWPKIQPSIEGLLSHSASAPVQSSPAANHTQPQSAQAQPLTDIYLESSPSAAHESAEASTPGPSQPKSSASHGKAAAESDEASAPNDAPEAIVVKNHSSLPHKLAPREEAVAAPSLTAVAGTGDKAISGIISASPTNIPVPAPKALKVSQGVSQGLLVHKVQPVYPTQAMRMHREGAVQLQANISADGTVTAVHVLNGDSVLSRAATDAVKQWKYKPYLLDGQPIAIETQITVNFKLP